MSDPTERPNIVTDAVEEYMRDLRDGGTINMLGAGPYLEVEFDMSKSEAREVIVWWMSQ